MRPAAGHVDARARFPQSMSVQKSLKFRNPRPPVDHPAQDVFLRAEKPRQCRDGQTLACMKLLRQEPTVEAIEDAALEMGERSRVRCWLVGEIEPIEDAYLDEAREGQGRQPVYDREVQNYERLGCRLSGQRHPCLHHHDGGQVCRDCGRDPGADPSRRSSRSLYLRLERRALPGLRTRVTPLRTRCQGCAPATGAHHAPRVTPGFDTASPRAPLRRRPGRGYGRASAGR